MRQHSPFGYGSINLHQIIADTDMYACTLVLGIHAVDTVSRNPTFATRLDPEASPHNSTCRLRRLSGEMSSGNGAERRAPALQW